MGYELRIIKQFSAAHSLRGYRGKCEGLHGHNWKVELVVSSEKLNASGMVVDFKNLKKKLNRILFKLDHRYLNKITFFKKTNPTSENIARYIFEKLKEKNLSYKIKEVVVWESEDALASFKEE
ncbi:MAG: 6-carboxytetrahydropterin synthase QueD [Candidatus Omnitrophica bacterium]|nr:6-carboxytetrahydropterin synthase QueD [Candidatus Omnitrophota bacterium]